MHEDSMVRAQIVCFAAVYHDGNVIVKMVAIQGIPDTPSQGKVRRRMFLKTSGVLISTLSNAFHGLSLRWSLGESPDTEVGKVSEESFDPESVDGGAGGG